MADVSEKRGAQGPAIGRPLDRVEGKLKVTGAALYTGDYHLPKMAYAVLIESTIAHGRVTRIDSQEASKAPGVIRIITHQNALALKAPEEASKSAKPAQVKEGAKNKPTSEAHRVLQSDEVLYNGQTIGVVVAESFEQARYAASLVKVAYAPAAAFLDMADAHAPSVMPPDRFGKPLQGARGDPPSAFSAAAAVVEESYETPMQHHNPMEPHATIASWKGSELTLYESTQYINGVQDVVSQCFGIAPKQVKVISHFVGGGFGSKGSTWQHTTLAAMAAKQVGRPVKLILKRQNMFNGVGHRSQTLQKVALAADKDGKIQAIRHDVQSHTSELQDFIEPSSLLTRMLYANPHLAVSHRLTRLNLPTSTFMRAPGETSGSFAVECALDELAYKMKIDPLELRLINHADADPDSGKAWSSKHLKECYEKGAERFGWKQRQAAPASMKKDGKLIGWGVATATYPGNRMTASARMQITRDGLISAASATHEIGQGTYTVMTQIAAEEMAVDVSRVRFELGSSLMPKAPVTGGSMTAASVGPAVAKAGRELKKKLLVLASKDESSPLYGLGEENVIAQDGKLVNRARPEQGQSYQDILAKAKVDSLSADATAESQLRGETKDHCRNNVGGDDPSCYSFHSFGAQFAEVAVDPRTGQVRVTRFVGVFDVGRILNEKTARSQGLGGIVMGIGMALMEASEWDRRTGRIVTRNLADYHVPVHADVQNIDIVFTNIPDTRFNEIGSRGLGEIPIVGSAAAIANAVYHATGKRIRQLPITPDKLI